jgi:hypothetical protein
MKIQMLKQGIWSPAILFMLFSVGCASIHPGNLAIPVTGQTETSGLKVSTQMNHSLSDDHYAFVTITIENIESQMIRTVDSSLSLDIEGKELPNVIVGQDLTAWLESADAKEKVNAANRMFWNNALMLGGLATSIAGGASRNASVTAVGTGALMVGVTKSAVEGSRSVEEAASHAKRVPETHLYSPFSVTAGGFVRKWIVFEKPQNKLPEGVVIKLVFEDRSEGKYAVALQ